MIEMLDAHIPTIIAIAKILPPIWWSIGIIGNILALLVWLQPKMRHSSGCYLAALAITDLCFVPLSVVYEINHTYSIPILDKPVLCQWFAISFLAVQYMSPVFVLAFTVERYLSVCHPFRMVKFNQSNIRVTVLVILGLSFGCVAVNAAHGYFWTTFNDIQECDLRVSSRPTWTIVIWISEMLIFALVPLTVLGLNILVIVEVRNISTLEKQNMRIRSIDRRSTTLMLLGVSFYQIFTVLPVTVLYIIYSQIKVGDSCMTDAQMSADPTWQKYFHYWGTRIFIQNVGMSHYAVNFFIYLMTGKLFRKQLYEMFVLFCCKGKLLYLSSKTSMYTRTTRLSLTSNRGSIGRGRLNNLKTNSDPCNNDTELGNKNPLSSTYGGTDGEGYVANGGVKAGTTQSKLLTCVEESTDAADTSDREDTPMKTNS